MNEDKKREVKKGEEEMNIEGKERRRRRCVKMSERKRRTERRWKKAEDRGRNKRR